MKKYVKKAALAVSAVAVSASSFAQQVPTDPGITAINGLASTATGYITAAFAVAVLVAGGFWGITMMRKAFNKAG